MTSPIERRKDGRYAVQLDDGVRSALIALSGQLVPALESHDPVTRRLFPPAYPGEEFRQAELDYRNLVDGALVNHHRQALDVLAETAGADSLSEVELHAWLSAVGSIRLVLGTRLDVSEDMVAPASDDPAAPDHALYDLLGELQYLIVEVLAEQLPDEGQPEGPL